ncbi:MAG: hypothetical protein WC998_05380 [Candidatus Paceibacterota bacterium]|jgi:hypothetical protein
MAELKHIDLSSNILHANGVDYEIKYSLTVERWKTYEKLQNHFAFGLAFDEIESKIKQSIDYANQGKGIEAWNIIYNLREGIAYRLEDREHPALLLMSLFILAPGEDITTWDEESQKKKIADWNAEGYDINDFFQLAANFVKNFLPVYKEIFPNISQSPGKGKSKPTVKK